MENNNATKPKIFLTLRIIGFSLLGFGAVMSAIGLSLFGNFDSGFIGIVLLCFGGFCFVPGIALVAISFTLGINKTMIKTTKYIQEDNKEDLKDIASTEAEIKEAAITRTAKAVKKGFVDTKFCKHCGEEIDADSKFCSKCGKEQ